MFSKQILRNWATVCTALLFVSSSFGFSYKQFDYDPSIESLVQNANDEKDKILQYCIDRSDDLLLTMFGSIRRMIRTELNSTEIDILDNRANEDARKYTNEVWLQIDQAEKALDILFKNTERRIEDNLGKQSPALDDVEDVFKEMSTILWRWQDDNGRLLYDANERGQQTVDGVAYEALDALEESGWEGVEQVLRDRADAVLQISNDVRDDIIERAENDNIRLHELSLVLRNAARQGADWEDVEQVLRDQADVVAQISTGVRDDIVARAENDYNSMRDLIADTSTRCSSWFY